MSASQVIDEAKLDAWQSYDHPDLVDVGDTEYEYPTPFQTRSLQEVLTHSEALAEWGVDFSPIHELKVDLDDSEFSDATEYEESLFRLSVNGTPITLPEADGEQTLAQTIAPGDEEVAVTFSGECADEFPSVQYLAPGNPLLGQLVEAVHDASDGTERLRCEATFRSEGPRRPVVCGWGRDGSVARVAADGGVAEEMDASILDSWSDVFLRNREESSTTSS